jgi:hypothetical protein
MVRVPIIITCDDCGEQKPHHALDLCITCYLRQYRRKRTTVEVEVATRTIQDGVPSDWYCADCDSRPGLGWYKDLALCWDCALERLKEANLEVRRLEHVMRQK